ncbi:hypothetical protein B0T10DRAFT_569446 [Thelonectria olida]|uniref:PRISE-like Rossmann-fold domain-containing protein n=1 Tax=Thelonectria olida TaxID=1576542 RepID=A0A9P9AJ33_9HYPO|nr:hypothetical protein B0T10DRAFT_569446 [Thelonectria olida]
MAEDKYAIVFGASGVSGWSFVNEILNDYPKKGVWSGVFALTNRPLTLEQSQWPDDGRLTIVSGIDLLEGSQEILERLLREKLPDISKVTHLIYLAFKAQKDIETEVKENVSMFQRATTAMDRLSPALEFVVLQTGSKAYGCHLLHDRPAIMKPPLSESLPRLPAPYDAGIFYNQKLDWLAEYSAIRKWGWAETRPDIIIGFVPNQNFFSLATVLGIYLSLRRELDGEGAQCPFPGTQASWETLSNDSSADMVARQTLHVALTGLWKSHKGEAFNVADERRPSCWRDKWPVLCAYFGLRGVKLDEDNPVEVRQYIREHMPVWEAMEKKYGLQSGHANSPRIYPGFEYWLLTMFDTDRQYDMSKMYDEVGFTEERDTAQSWGGVFDRMARARIIPTRFE